MISVIRNTIINKKFFLVFKKLIEKEYFFSIWKHNIVCIIFINRCERVSKDDKPLVNC